MNPQRRGTNSRIIDRLKRHDELMKQFIAQGMTRDEASKEAYRIVTAADTHIKKEVSPQHEDL